GLPGLEVDISPTQGHEFAGSQAVAVGDHDGRGIPMAPAVFPRSLNQPLDFPLGEVLTGPSRAPNCYIYCHWGAHPGRRIFHCFSQWWLETVTVLPPQPRLMIAGDDELELRQVFKEVLAHESCCDLVSASKRLDPAFRPTPAFFGFNGGHKTSTPKPR